MSRLPASVLAAWSHIPRKILEGIFWLFLSAFSSQLVTWIFTILIIRILCPEDFALVELLSIVLALLECLCDFGTGAIIKHFQCAARESLELLFTLALTFSVWLTGILWVFLLAGCLIKPENLRDVWKIFHKAGQK